jgi:phosphoribosylaminoimidazole-succinocarboxamide synthase
MIPELVGLADRHLHAGKVRELYTVGDDQLLMVATDRISAFDWVLPTPIPDKGAILTGLTLWWFEQLADIVPTHLVTADVADYPDELAPYAEFLRGRSMLCRRLDMVAVECVARGYLTGSGYKSYVATGMVSGITLPAGLLDGSRLPEPIFTPTTKAPVGQHDEAIDFATVVAQVGEALAETLRDVTLAIYRRAGEIAERAGILLADTKVELGTDPAGTLTLGDEVLTPDSSRFWPADGWKPGQPQPSYDKQYVRDWLLNESGWDRVSPPPPLPDDVATATRAKYVEAYEVLTGTSFRSYLQAGPGRRVPG